MAHQSELNFERAFAAELALEGMSGKERVHFALKLMLDVRDPRAAGPLTFAARQMGDHANALNRESQVG